MKTLKLILVLLFLLPSLAFGAGRVDYDTEEVRVTSTTDWTTLDIVRVMTINWLADASGVVTAATIDVASQGVKGWLLYSVETDPGSTAPTTLYDITLDDANGADLAGGILMNRSATATEGPTAVALGSGGHYPRIRGDFTFTLTNNSAANSTGTVILVFEAK